MPYLKKLTDVSDGEDPELDLQNYSDSLEFYRNYQVLSEFLVWIEESLGLEHGEVEVGEGFKSLRLHEEVDLDPYDAESHEFKNLIFTIPVMESSLIVEWIQTQIENFKSKARIRSVVLDIDTGYFLIKITGHEDPLVEETDFDIA